MPVLLPLDGVLLELPEPIPDDGVVGDLVVLPLVLPLPVVPLAPLPALEPDLLKWASHSEREMLPSLLVSTAEKFGVVLLVLLLPDMPLEPPAAEPLLLDGALDEPLDEPELPLVADGVDLSLLVLDDELCAMAALESASSAAAVAALSTFRFNIRESPS